MAEESPVAVCQAVSVSRLRQGSRFPLAPAHIDGALHPSADPYAAGALRWVFPAGLSADLHAGERALTSSRWEYGPYPSGRCL